MYETARREILSPRRANAQPASLEKLVMYFCEVVAEKRT
jgi:hypothetical protein